MAGADDPEANLAAATSGVTPSEHAARKMAEMDAAFARANPHHPDAINAKEGASE